MNRENEGNDGDWTMLSPQKEGGTNAKQEDRQMEEDAEAFQDGK